MASSAHNLFPCKTRPAVNAFNPAETVTYKAGFPTVMSGGGYHSFPGGVTAEAWNLQFQRMPLRPGEITITSLKVSGPYQDTGYIDKAYIGVWLYNSVTDVFTLLAMLDCSAQILAVGSTSITLTGSLAVTVPTLGANEEFHVGALFGKIGTLTAAGGGFRHEDAPGTLPTGGRWLSFGSATTLTPFVGWQVGTGQEGGATTDLTTSWGVELTFTAKPKKADGTDNLLFFEPQRLALAAGAQTGKEILVRPATDGSKPWWLYWERVEISAGETFTVGFKNANADGLALAAGDVTIDMGATDKVSVLIGAGPAVDVALADGEEDDEELAVWINWQRDSTSTHFDVFYCDFTSPQGPLAAGANTRDIDWKSHAILASGAAGARMTNEFYTLAAPSFIELSGTLAATATLSVAYYPLMMFGDSQTGSGNGQWACFGTALKAAFGRPAMLAGIAGSKVAWAIADPAQTAGYKRFAGPCTSSSVPWNFLTAYVANGIAEAQGKHYKCLLDNTGVLPKSDLTKWMRVVGDTGHIFQMQGMLFVWDSYGTNDISGTDDGPIYRSLALMADAACTILSDQTYGVQGSSWALKQNKLFIIGIAPRSNWYYPRQWQGGFASYTTGNWVHDATGGGRGNGYYKVAGSATTGLAPSADIAANWAGPYTADQTPAYTSLSPLTGTHYPGDDPWWVSVLLSIGSERANQILSGLAMGLRAPFFSPWWHVVDKATVGDGSQRAQFLDVYTQVDGTAPTQTTGLHWNTSASEDVMVVANAAKAAYEAGVMPDRARLF